MKILFINPPIKELHYSRSQRSPGVIKSGTMYYPYWLAHAAALADQHSHEIHLIDCPADNINVFEMVSIAKEFKPDLVILDTSTASISHDHMAAQRIKESISCLCVAVGTHVTSEWKSCLIKYKSFDFIAIGEYDYTIIELAALLTDHNRSDSNNPFQKLLKLPGIAFRNEIQLPQRGPTRLPIENMDNLPWIAPIYKRFLTPQNYLFTIARQPMVMLIGGRGCKAKCFYCVYPQVMHGHAYRTRSPKHIVDEMEWIQNNMPEIKEVVFEDDTFTIDRGHAIEFAKLKKERNVHLPFFANIRTNIDIETLSALQDAGLRECAVGFESGDDLILKNMRKGQTVEIQKRFIEHARQLKLLVHGCFMVGFPGETPESMKKTLELALDLNPDSAQFYPVMPYPGTSAYQWAKDNNFLTTNNFDEWVTPEGRHRCVLNLPGLPPEEIEQFCEYAFKKFHFRPRYIAKKLLQLLTNPYEGKRSINAGINFLFSILSGKKTPNLITNLKPAYSEWENRTKTLPGRMENIEKTITHGEKNGWEPVKLSQELLKAETETERSKN